MDSGFLENSLLAVAIVVSFPLLVLAIECLAALFPSRRSQPLPAISGRIDVLIPAHDESAGIAATLQSIRAQLRPQDRVVVVADNCHDDTAAVARAQQAIVLERSDAERRGKSFALDFGLRHVSADPPAVLILVDADCQIEPGALRELAAQAVATGQPIQSCYLMHCPRDPSPRDVVSQCAVTLKNLIRPLGLHKLGFPCALTGSGMAFPWSIMDGLQLASGSIVEDMQLGIDLQIDGYRPRFCPQARVVAALPGQAGAATAQRRRWEHGHLHVIMTQVPRLLAVSLRQRRLDLAVAAFDTAVPPLSLLALLGAAGLSATLVVGVWQGIWLPAEVIGGTGTIAVVAVLITWRKFAARCNLDVAAGSTALHGPQSSVVFLVLGREATKSLGTHGSRSPCWSAVE